ncbi:MAG: filamentous hemagglutinin N-terminal domain-containing protein, partial [Acidobacteriota bacterium]|nr:filamentous hemagglutinin N-terminal domain-containing protein [Acidobacteriota bacterium]
MNITAAAMVLLLLHGQVLLAQYGQQGAVVTSGSADISQVGNVTNIRQSTDKAAINWLRFNIRPEETVNFNQPGASSVTLNRVVGNERSVLEGALNANGKVFLLNSNGVLITKGANVNTAGFLASALDLTDEDFNAGRHTFVARGAQASVINQGIITARDGGYVALLGRVVSNQGTITATKGTVALASGDRITLRFKNPSGDSLIGVAIDEGAFNALVENKGAITADGGRVYLTARAADELLSTQVNTSGIIRAQTIGDLKGVIELGAIGGTTNVAGTLNASAPGGGDGGFVETSGDQVKIADDATINTRAANGTNGEWLIDPDGFTVGATASDGDMSAATLNAALSSGSVTISSTTGHGGDGNININGAVSWSNNTLTLNATNNILANNVVTAAGAANLTANYGIGANADETPRGLYTASGDAGSRIDFSGAGELWLGGERYTVIGNASQLAAARGNPSGLYALGYNVNASAITGWIPLDNNSAAGFTGKFNGLGHQVAGFGGVATSFFGTVGEGSVISNFSIYSGQIAANSAAAKKSAGILADINRGIIVNSGVTGIGTLNITDAANRSTNIESAGGLVGTNYGLIVRSSSATAIKGVTSTVGGLVGVNEGRIIDSRATTGSILNAGVFSPTTGYAGGLVGINTGSIKRSYANIMITMDGANDPRLSVGGFVGKNVGTIDESYATGSSPSTAPRFGGFVGENTGTITNAYTTHLYNPSTANKWDAGFAYSNAGGIIRNAYAVAWSVNTDGPRYGFVRDNTGGTIENVYWSASVVDGATEPNLTPGAIWLSTEAAKNFANYNFGSGMSGIWAASKSGYPILRNIPVYVVTDTPSSYGRATADGSSLGLYVMGLQGGGGDWGSLDSLSKGAYNPFTVKTTGGYVDAGVWNAAGILTGSYYTNIQGTVRVNPKLLTVSGMVRDKTYDGTTTALLSADPVGLTGLVGSQTLNVNWLSAVFQDKNAGYGKAVDLAYVVSDGANGGKASNYAIGDTASANILPKPVDVAVVGNDKIYDGTTTATVNGQISGMIAGDDLSLAYTAVLDGKNAGSRTMTVTGISLAGQDANNYKFTSLDALSTPASVKPRPLQLYGFAEEGDGIRVSAENLNVANVVGGDSVTLGGSVAIASAAAGAQPITDFSSLTIDNPNYTVSGSVGSVIVGGAKLSMDRVTAGDASVAVSGKTTTITQTTDKAVIDWLRFSVGKDETLVFAQPSSSSIVLNRVTTNLRSVIEGVLRANGRVFILNAGGVLFTANSSVNAGGLVAGTFDLTDDNFLKDNYIFTVAESGGGSIIAQGSIVIADGGFVALAGSQDVTHTGETFGGDQALLASTD